MHDSMQRLTSSFALFVNRGQQASSHAEIYDVFRVDNLYQY